VHVLLGAMAAVIALMYVGVQIKARVPLIATALFTIAGALTALGVVVFYGLN
jgi:hypothetical protein